MAQGVSSHQHIPDTLLQELRQKVEAAQPGVGREVLDEVYDNATIAIWERPCCSSHIRAALHVAKDAVFKHVDLKHISSKTTEQVSYLAVLAMELFSSKARTHNAVLDGAWESAGWQVVLMASFCTPDMAHHMLQTRSTMEWIKVVFCTRNICPNPHLRLEMMRFMVFWSDQMLLDPILGTDVLQAMVLLASRLKLNDMFPQGRPSLSEPFACFMQNCHRLGLLKVLAGRACMQVKRLRIGSDERFFARVVRLQGEKAKVLRYMCHNASLGCLVIMKEYRHLLETLKVMVVSDYCRSVFKLPGFKQVGAAAIAATTISLYRSSTKLAAADADCFKKLTEQLNNLMLDVRLENKILGKELMTNHERTLLRAVHLADEVGFPLQYLPMRILFREPDGPCERFIDPVTGKIMEDPVKVFSPEIVIDLSTLVGFMVFTVKQPCTIAYIPLTELRREILEWQMPSQLTRCIASVVI